MSIKQKHAHRLRRHTYKTGTSVFFCTLPDCYFKAQCEHMLGKPSICNLCGNEFIMNGYQVKLKSPHCDDCSKIRIKGHDGRKYYVRRRSLPFQAQIISLPTGGVEEKQDVAAVLKARLGNVLEPDEDKDI